MRPPKFLTRWLCSDAEPVDDTAAVMQGNHFDLEDITKDLCTAYTGLVNTGADRRSLAKVITGLAGCCLAQSFTGFAAWGPEDGLDDEKWSVPDTDGLAGLLLLEVARCADDGPVYRMRGVVAELEAVEPALLALAKSYADEDSSLIGQRLYELGCAVGESTGSAAGEALMPLARAHGFCSDCLECREVAS